MNWTIVAASSALMLAAGSANAFTVDLAGQTSDGEDFTTIVVNNADAGEVLRIEFAFIYDSSDSGASLSWGSELVVQIGHLPTQTYAQIGTLDVGCTVFGFDCSFDLMWPEEGGVFTASGSFLFSPDAPVLDGSGDWEIFIADSFNDVGNDGVFLDGSSITVSQVPVPAAVWFLGSALFSLLGLRRLTT